MHPLSANSGNKYYWEGHFFSDQELYSIQIVRMPILFIIAYLCHYIADVSINCIYEPCLYLYFSKYEYSSAIRNIWTRVQEAIAKVAWMSQHYEISLPDWVFAFFERKSVYTVITEKNSKKLLRKILVILIV